MKKLFIIIGILCIPVSAIAENEAVFDFSLGVPMVMEDATSVCTDTATVRYEFTYGTPSPVFDATANCTAAGGAVVPDKNRKLLTI